MNGYEKLKKLYDEIDNLIKQRVTSDTPSFITWRTKTERTLNTMRIYPPTIPKNLAVT